MRNLSNHWYRAIAVVCAFLFLIMVYRREARMRTHIERMEARIEALELYAQGKHQADSIRLTEHQTQEPNTLVPSRTATTPRHEENKRAHKTQQQQRSNTEALSTPPDNTANEDYMGKFRQVVKLELNTVDSATLVRIPGIAEGTARAILTYREKLGGYYSPEQLREKLTWESAQINLDSWCNEWFWADESLIQKTQINTLSFKELLNHPYLDFKDVKAIVKWRDRHQKVANIADLRQLGIDDSVKLEKLLHYVEF